RLDPWPPPAVFGVACFESSTGLISWSLCRPAMENWKEVEKLIEGKNFGNLATLMPDGSPQVTPVWVDHEGELILVNTAEGRVKLKNVTRDSRVALSVFDQDDPYHYVLIRGMVVEITKSGAE